MSRIILLLSCVALVTLPLPAFGQGDDNPLDIYGYFQGVFSQSFEKTTLPFLGTQKASRNTFLLQQLNVMGAKRFSTSFTCFLNLELTNSYSSERNWGNFNLEEAWLKYEQSDALNIKAGLLIPAFNNLHEIKNRTPLLPYVIRPLVYEATASDLFAEYDFLPEKAYLQIYGFVPVGSMKIDYAAYVGNGESSWSNSANMLFTVRGVDTTKFKLIGARVGVRDAHLKAGFSMTADKDNQTAIGLGPIHRLRFGGDLMYQNFGFTLESEIIAVDEQLRPEQQARLDIIGRMNPMLGTSLDRLFYYWNLTYDFSDQFFAYGGYQSVRNNLGAINQTGITGLTFGGGFRPIEAVVVKLQYFKLKTSNPILYEFIMDRYQAAVSVYF
jgi:hypothetical protein